VPASALSQLVTHQTPIDTAVAKLAALAQAKGISIDELIEMLKSCASVADILAALNTREKA